MNPLLAQFLAEARECLDGISSHLLVLERDPGDPAVVNELFRLMHTLKGNSGLFDFPDMTRVLHAGEDLLVALRDGRLACTPTITDRLLECCDLVGAMCNLIAAEGALDSGIAPASTAMAGALRALLGAGDSPVAAHGDSDAPQTTFAPPVAFLDAAALAAARQAEEEGATLHWVRYRPDEQCFFQGEDPFHTVCQAPAALWGTVRTREAWPALSALDPYRCVLEFHLLSAAPGDALTAHFRYVAEQVDIVEVRGAALEGREVAPPSRPASEQAIEALIATQREVLALEDAPAWLPGRLEAVATTLERCLLARGDRTADEALVKVRDEALATRSALPLRAWLAQRENGTGTAATPTTPKFGRRSEDALGSRTLKIDQDKIDRLMNLIGEFIVSKNALPYLARRAEQQYGSRELAREIKDRHAVLERIAEEMQDAIMQVRMTPFSFVSLRFSRLVRDIAQRLGKEVDLVVKGEDTEADRNIIEALADPLIHILRNSLDHGLETPEVRRAAGKPSRGNLCIRAMHDADRFVVEVSDDGRGIDPDAVRRSAVSKGLLEEAAAQRMSDHEATHLIFMPGFSTAAQVSDLSGRGVGMDVVRSTVERLGGRIELHSTPGRGTTLRLALPLSMAVTQVMVVEADRQLFGVPTSQVVETVRVPRGAVQRLRQREATVLRNRLVPMRNLHDLLGLEATPQENGDDELALLVARSGVGEVGLVVDEFRGCQDIIQKPLPGVLSGLNAYTGSALLGDGSVLMVLNLSEIV